MTDHGYVARDYRAGTDRAAEGTPGIAARLSPRERGPEAQPEPSEVLLVLRLGFWDHEPLRLFGYQ